LSQFLQHQYQSAGQEREEQLHQLGEQEGQHRLQEGREGQHRWQEELGVPGVLRYQRDQQWEE